MADSSNPRVFGKYEVIRRLAVGGMGEIFLARQVGVAGFDRLVILKSLLPQLAEDPDMLSQFLDEARIVGSINHPSVVACYEVGEWDGVYFIAMEYVNGVDLATLQKACANTGQSFPLDVALSIVREAALGLDSAHHAADAQGRPLRIVHRDISPHNVMVRADGLAKVVDFGVATSTNRQKRTEGGMLKGKLGYIAPEQIKGQPVEPRSDQFSLGVVLWELLAGRRLYTGESPEAVFMQIVREAVPSLASVGSSAPPEVDAVVQRMTAQEPAQRFGRLSEVAAALRRSLEQRGAGDHEAADFVAALVGEQLAERVRDLAPSPVRILGISASASDSGGSASLCGTCGTQAVKGDRFCRTCGGALTGTRPPRGASSTPTSARGAGAARGGSRFVEVDDDVLDVAFDDASGPRETAVACGMLELQDAAGLHEPPEALKKPAVTGLQQLAARFGGNIMTTGHRFSVTFVGNGRAARTALAFARRAAGVARGVHADLRVRVGVGAAPGVSHGDESARQDAEHLRDTARAGQGLITERARKLANVVHPWEPGPSETWRVPLPTDVLGRAAELEALEAAVASADLGRGQQLLFLGGAGAGKTTLLHAADAEARDRGFVVASARGGRSRAGLRFDVLRQVLKSACAQLLVGSAAGSTAGGPWHKALELLAIDAHDRRRVQAFAAGEVLHEDVPPVRRRVLLRSALHACFAALAERRGLCVLVDDVDRGDAPSLELLAEQAARLDGARFVLVAAGRPLHGERVLPLAKRMVLGPLDAHHIGTLVSQALGGRAPPALVQAVVAKSDGAGAVAVALVRFLSGMGLVSARGGEVWTSADLGRFPLPPDTTVLGLASQGLLSPEAHEVLQVSALLGEVVEPEDVALAAPDLDVASAFEQGAAQGVLVLDGGRASFVRSSDADAVAARLSPAAARALHVRVADALDARGPSQVGLELQERLWFHRRAGGDGVRAGHHAELAADAWAGAGLAELAREPYRQALQSHWRALNQGGAPPDEARARHVLELCARATTALGDVEPSVALDLALPFLRLLPDTLAVSARVRASQARAALLLKLRRTEEALLLLEQTAGQYAAQLPPAAAGSLLLDVALAREQGGQPEAARAQLADAERTLQEAPADARARTAELLLARGRVCLRLRAHAAAREALTLAVAEARSRKSVSSLIEVLSVLSTVEQNDGNVERALALLDDALSAAASVGDRVAEARLKQQAARTLQQLGRIPDALHVARQALLVSQRVGWDEGASVAAQLVQSLEARG